MMLTKTYGRVELRPTKQGTYTLWIIQRGREPLRHRTGIPTQAEALVRARTVAGLLHLQVKDRT